MISWLQQQWAKFRARRRGEMGEKALIDVEAVEGTFEQSRVPAVLMLVLVWAVCSVLLILSHQRQRSLDDWIDGQIAPYSINARGNFSYIDTAATESRREEARAEEPEYYRLENRRSNEINSNIGDFFLMVANRSDRKAQGRPPVIPDSLPARLAESLSPPLLEALAREYARGGNYPVFLDLLRQMLHSGILGAKARAAAGQENGIRIVDGSGRIDRDIVFPSDIDDVATASDKLALALFPQDAGCRDEFRKVLAELFGDSGNLHLDHERTDEARRKAAAAVPKVVVHVSKGELLVRKGEVFTATKRECVRAESKAMPESDLVVAYEQMVWSFFMLAALIFSLCMVSPRIRHDNLRIVIAALGVIIALFVNYEAIHLFGFLLRNALVTCESLVQCAVPAALCSVMLAIMLDSRTAICCGGLVAGITAMMIMPDRSLELALRWSAISSVAALAVVNVTNYRSFFVRTVVCVFFTTWAVHLDVILKCGGVQLAWEKLLIEALLLILSNSVLCAMTALVLIFVFELVFNLSTNMALMVLCDCNHPLLERLKREAPGTMAHAMAVATIAEDAARAIGANPLRAKAGALFHDIGKLAMPQYFTENNPDSALQHANLTPQMSSSIIRDHVKEGLTLARQHRLCRFIREVIASHHGDDLVSFFYRQAQERSKPGDAPVLESQFRYHGEPPSSREAGIVNLADACEAASRSLKHPTPENIADMVRNIIDGRFKSGQLRNSILTASDLDLIAKSFISTLSSSMHGRIAYPKENGGERAREDKKC